jgi:hypothetical protein
MKRQQAAPKQDTADRGARIIRRAIEIMAAGAHGWSWAIEQAKKEVTNG